PTRFLPPIVCLVGHALVGHPRNFYANPRETPRIVLRGFAYADFVHRRCYESLVGYARKSLVSLNDTPYYHVIARCVRRAWLWGFDEYAGRDYSHRKAWVLERMADQSSVFAIDICAFAILSNHYHLVLHVDSKRDRKSTRLNSSHVKISYA